MFFPEGQVRVHVHGRPVDMRKSFDGLYALTRRDLGQDPLSGRLFVFINRRATQMKVLYWDRTGFCIWAKRLEQGRFLSDWRRVTTREMDWRTRIFRGFVTHVQNTLAKPGASAHDPVNARSRHREKPEH